MAKSLENEIYERVIVDLKNIDGTGDYNNNIPDEAIKDEFVMFDQADHDVTLCMGDFISSLGDPNKRRNAWDIPFVLEVWGYIKRTSFTNDLYGETLKLGSDIRMAVCADEHLNNLITNMKFQIDSGAIENLGVICFTIMGSYCYEIL